MQGSLFIITAASGTGKTSLVTKLISTIDNLKVSISHTTRPSRSGETHGQHYYFTQKETFLQRVAEGDFLEYAEVFGNYYGTSRTAVMAQLESGLDVILEIDWQGALQVQELFDEVTMIFILPPSLDTLRQRLSNRGQDSMQVIDTRMATALDDMRHYHSFDYLVVNDDFEAAFKALQSIIMANRQTLKRQQTLNKQLITKLLN